MILQINSTRSLPVNVPIMITLNLRHDPDLLIDIKDFMEFPRRHPPTASPSRLRIWRIGRIIRWNFASGDLARAS